MRLSIGNARKLSPLQEHPLRPIGADQILMITTEAPGITIESAKRDMKEVTNDVRNDGKVSDGRILGNEQTTIDLHQQLKNITGAANALTGALQKALWHLTLQQELHQNNLSHREDCLLRSRNLLEEQQQFNAVTQQKIIATHQRMGQYEAVMWELAQESRLIHENFAQHCRQGAQNQVAQVSHEAETI